ncbi:MAG: DNA polymerase III subunit gamma/tau [Lentisphaeria bacterium]|nr:DNA polymerase III subunit gamma/tau [Lentisphaeria bacterium]
MSEYQVIARKWRPQCFGDVVGQQHVVRTLKNAIIQNRTAHAYLFVGPRGVGKTTLARIFAKALNCADPRNGEPCCKCESCLAISQDRSLDVLEVDAASRNSTTDMRELSEDVLTRPVGGKYKIYIIDEVHMLSKQAWNVLLKTVEEPPGHVKFIFATTEVHQVLPTIISRCQRFDLLPIPTRLIADRLRLIADTEKVAIRQDAVDAIARAAEGGMRDAQSLLDQMIAFFSQAGDEITGEQVLSLFGLTDRGDLDALLNALLNNTPGEAVSIVGRLAKRGKNLETLFDDLLNALRIARLCSILPDPGELLDEGEETISHYQELTRRTNPAILQTLLETLAPTGRILHDALNKQVYLETLLLKAMREAHAVRLDDILARLNQLRSAGELKFLDQLPPVTAPENIPEPVKKKTVLTAEEEPRPVPPPPQVERSAPRVERDSASVSDSAPVIPEAAAAPEPAPAAEPETPPEPAPREAADEVPPAVENVPDAALPAETVISDLEDEEPCGSPSDGKLSDTDDGCGEVSALPQDAEYDEAPPPVPPASYLPAETARQEVSVVPPGDHRRESIIGKDSTALRTALQDPAVKTLVGLFEGRIVDIHR